MAAYQNGLGTTHYNLGLFLTEQHQPDEAARHYDKALAIQQRLADDYPEMTAYYQNLARTHSIRGVLLTKPGQWEKAEKHYRKAVTISQELADAFPSMIAYRVDLGGVCCNYANLLLVSGRPGDSLTWYDEAIRVLSPVQQDPRMATARHYLRNSHMGRAQAFEQLGRGVEAIKDWNRVIELSPPQEQLPYHIRRARCRVRAGQVEAAVAEVAELRKSLTATVCPWYDFACIYALASGKKKEYAEQAMRCLRHAVQAGYMDVEHMAKDRDLDPLRGREDFKKLMQSLARPKAKD
jgi:tetratricopeptide (TPR) repeat protein